MISAFPHQFCVSNAYRVAPSKWAFRLTGVLSDLVNSAHLLSEIEFAQVARIWSEDAMLDPLWWRTWEDRCREEEFPPVPVAPEIPDDVQAFLTLNRPS